MSRENHTNLPSRCETFAPRVDYSYHSLAMEPVPQDIPRIVTNYFDTIASLMNGSGPTPRTRAQSKRAHGPANIFKDMPASAERDIYIKLPFDAVLREEDFGGILFSAHNGGYVFLNRPATDAILGNIDEKEAALRLSDELSSLFDGPYTDVPSRVITYEENLRDALNFPISATLELTYSCHHSCKHCMYSSSPKASRVGEMTVTEWENIIRDMRSNGLCDIYFSGGEITRYNGYEQLFSLCDELGLSYLLVSDLAGHSDFDFQVLNDAKNLSSVMVSLDGHSSAAHDFLRGPGAFAKTLAGIKKLTDASVPVGVYHSVHVDNLDSVPDFIDFANALGIDNVVVGVACPMGRAEKSLRGKTLDNDECLELTKYYLDAVLEGKVNPPSNAWNGIAEAYKATGRCDNVFATWRDFAHAGTHRVHLSPSGNIHFCPKFQATEYSTVGNVQKDDVKAVWRSNVARTVRNRGVLTNFIFGTVPLTSN